MQRGSHPHRTTEISNFHNDISKIVLLPWIIQSFREAAWFGLCIRQISFLSTFFCGDCLKNHVYHWNLENFIALEQYISATCENIIIYFLWPFLQPVCRVFCFCFCFQGFSHSRDIKCQTLRLNFKFCVAESLLVSQMKCNKRLISIVFRFFI